MKILFRLATAFSFLILSFQQSSYGAQRCSCYPIPESKKYAVARKKLRFNRFESQWSCQYKCYAGKADAVIVTGRYQQTFSYPENGLEGICEGMIYNYHDTPNGNQMYVYLWEGQTESFNPAKSNSEDLKNWSKSVECKQPLFSWP